jgi:anti-anti-sigma regulatory factor
MDLSEILTFDSVGLGQLNSAIRKLRQSGCSVAVANVPPNLERTMRVLSLDIGVQFIDDVSSFLASPDA